MAKPGNTGFLRVKKATLYSIQGFRSAYQHEEAFRQELWLVLCAVVLAMFIANTLIQFLLLTLTGLLVLVVELLNSAIEAVVDRISDQWHELAGRAKDMGSAAVFTSLVIMGLTWAIIIWETQVLARFTNA